MPLTDSPLLALLLISSTLSTPIISFPDLLMSKSDRIDNCRSKAAVGAGLTISENFRLPEWKAAFTIFVNQTLPNTAADRGRKNDRRDAEWLARLLACRNVVEVWVPDERTEAARDLSRALEDAREDLHRAKQRMSKFLLRHGLVFDETTPGGRRRSNWTEAYWRWARSIEFDEADDAAAYEHYTDAVDRCGEAKRELERRVVEAASRPEWAPTVDALCLVKGVDVATAFLLAAEAGDFSRFPSAPSFAAWCGLAPSERSSGETESRGGITRAGNSHVRRALVEASWHVPMSTRHPKKPRPGHGVAPAASRHAAKCNRRLQDRRDAMSQAGKRPCVANCATAREMACWVWAIALMVR